LANPGVANFKPLWGSTRNPSEGNGGEENGREMDEHVGVDAI